MTEYHEVAVADEPGFLESFVADMAGTFAKGEIAGPEVWLGETGAYPTAVTRHGNGAVLVLASTADATLEIVLALIETNR